VRADRPPARKLGLSDPTNFMNKLFDVNPEEATRLVLVRHGRTASNAAGRIQGRADVPLDPTGLDEAQAVARALRRFGASALYTSPLSRARTTAEIIGRELGLTAQPREDLTEYEFGLMSERNLEDLGAANPRLGAELDAWLEADRDDPMLRPEIPGAEPLDAFSARIAAFWDHVETAHRGGTAIAVTHGGVLRGIFKLAAGGDLRRHSPFWADNCSISVLDFYRMAVVVRLFNDTGHVGAELRLGKNSIL
jgi:broad specificity phosphatase PhoE